MPMIPTPFRVEIGDDAIADLHFRLDRVCWPRFAEGVGWRYGIDPDYARSLVHHWRHDFDWRVQEAAINALPQFIAEIDGTAIHYFHVRGKGPSPLPLILSHGWPSSFVEWLAVVDMLTDPERHGGDPRDAFDVIIPSLPGYGFSTARSAPGDSPYRVCKLWPTLMSGLGYSRYGAHGCDIGAHVTALMGLDGPPGLVGIHMGSVPIPPAQDSRHGEQTVEEVDHLARSATWREREGGYIAIQSTKPNTLAVGLADSPAGLAVWVAEKWRAWSDCGDVPEVITPRDVLLTNISVYWFTNTIGSSVRYYYETAQVPRRLPVGRGIEVPCGFFLESPGLAADPATGRVGRIGPPPRDRVETSYNVQRWFVAPNGGHFPALEVPDMLVRELRGFFAPLR
jgi:pimeloyl-ACP methyl ester carboxylesterase